MKNYNAPEMEICDLRQSALLTLSDETDIIRPYGDADPAD